MKCKYCGAEIKPGSNVCEYCDSAVEREEPKDQTIIIQKESPASTIFKVLGRIIIVLVCAGAATTIISLFIILNSDAFKNTYENTYEYTYEYTQGINAVREMPQNETDLTGQIISCDKNGVASIQYDGYTYTDVEILDKDLITWLNDNGRTIDTVGIRFATDEKGSISELGLLSPDFFIFAEKDSQYIAVRGEQVISFTSRIPLKTDCYYSGYFSYPDLQLYWGEENRPFTMYLSPKCDDKESTIEQDHYTGEDITVYKLLAKGDWHYCSKETFDAVQPGDWLDEYKIYSGEEFTFIAKE